MKKTNQITTTNITNNTNNTNTTTNKGVNNMKKTKRFKTRLIAGILSAITVFSVGTMAIGSASAFPLPLSQFPESLKPYSAPPSATRRMRS